jgi:hypothetical protein
MNSDDGILEYERGDFKESTKSLTQDDISWLLKRLVKQYPELNGYEKDPDKEWKLLSRANQLLYSINEDKPSDIRAYVEKELRKKEYDNRLKELSDRITSGLLGDNEKCDRLSDEINQLLDDADKEFPGFRKGRALQVSEIFQRIMAYRTKGAIGHQGEIREIRKEHKKRSDVQGKSR